MLAGVGDYGRVPGSRSSQPIVVGGRIEVRAQGFALAVPDGWYALDLTDPDLISHMATYDAFTRGLLEGRVRSSGRPGASPAAYEGPGITLSQVRLRSEGEGLDPADAFYRLVAVAPWDGEPAIHECDVVVWPDPRLDLDRVAQLAESSSHEEYAVTSTSIVSLPAGPAVHTSMSGGRVDGAHPACSYELVRDGWFYSIHFVDYVEHSEQWRSIAESFEFIGGWRGRIWRRLTSTLLR